MKQKPEKVQRDAVPVEILAAHKGKNLITNEEVVVMTLRHWAEDRPHNTLCMITDTCAARLAIEIFKLLPKETVQAVAKQLCEVEQED